MAIGPHWPDPAKKIFQFPHGRWPTLPSAKPSVQQELWATFEAERPRILGALLDAVVEGLATLPQTKLEKLPRMADHQSPDAVPNPTKPPSRDYKRTCEHCPPAEAEISA